MPRLEIVYYEGGGGHRATALALRAAFEALGGDWTVSLLDIMEVVGDQDPLQRMTGRSGMDIYNKVVLEWGIHRAFWPLIKFGQAKIRHGYDLGIERLARRWATERPDAVLSVIPMFNAVLCESVRRSGHDTRFFTVMTDLADLPPNFWLVPQDQHYIVGSPLAAEQARRLGIAEQRVFRASGMVVHPRFYERHEPDRAAARRRLGLDADRPTVLVFFGAYAPRAVRRIARSLERCREDLQVLFLCGHNDAVAAELRGLRLRYPFAVEGFTRDVPRYMELADLFVGKPGPGSVTEALVKGLPVVVNRRTMPQERYNLQWLTDLGVGRVVDDWRDLHAAVDPLLRPDALRAARARVAALRLRGVYDTVDAVRDTLGARALVASA